MQRSGTCRAATNRPGSSTATRHASDFIPHALIGRRYPHTGPVGDSAWALRHNLTFYDALYVALASQLGVPLLTSDERVTHTAALPCAVELV